MQLDPTPSSRRPRVLFFDPITWIHDWSYDEEEAALEPLGVDIVVPPDPQARDAELTEADVVVVSSIENLTAVQIAGLNRCVGILCYSAGMDAVDQAAAAEAGIPVTNIRAGTADVADHAVTLLLAAWRRLPEMVTEVEAGRWDLEDHPHFREIPRLGGSTLGIFGAGAVGRAVGVRARAFDMNTIATYRRPDSAQPELPHVPLERLVAEAHAVVLTASLNASTAGAINAEILARARPGLIVVNVGRGGLIVERDLAEALDSGTVLAAALDVRDPEPPAVEHDLLAGRANVILTPHSAGVSAEALGSLHRLAAEGIEALLRDGGRL